LENRIEERRKELFAIANASGFPEEGSNHVKHISGNLLNGLSCVIQLVYEFNDPRYAEEDLPISDREIGEYLLLLEEYDDYREGEFNNSNGFFPDILDFGSDHGAHHYVTESRSRLEK